MEVGKYFLLEPAQRQDLEERWDLYRFLLEGGLWETMTGIALWTLQESWMMGKVGGGFLDMRKGNNGNASTALGKTARDGRKSGEGRGCGRRGGEVRDFKKMAAKKEISRRDGQKYGANHGGGLGVTQSRED